MCKYNLEHIYIEETICCTKKGNLNGFLSSCGRWESNPHDRIDHKILSLARLPVPTLPRTVTICCVPRYK